MNKNLVVIIGASSFIGRHLVRELKKHSIYRVLALTSSNEKLKQLKEFRTGVNVGVCDVLEAGALDEFIEEDCVVINLAFMSEAGEKLNLELVSHVLDSCNRVKVKRLIHCSTAEVYGRSKSKPVFETSDCCPVTGYAKTKLKLEEHILNTNEKSFECVILRPTAVFGVGGKNLIFLMDNILRGNHLLNYFRSCLYGKRRMNLVFVDNVIASIIYLMGYVKNIDNEIFSISDDQCSSNNYHDIEIYLINNFNVSKLLFPRIHVPSYILSLLLLFLRRDNIDPDRIVSIEKLTSIGFKKPIRFEEGLSLYSKWYGLKYINN